MRYPHGHHLQILMLYDKINKQLITTRQMSKFNTVQSDKNHQKNIK